MTLVLDDRIARDDVAEPDARRLRAAFWALLLAHVTVWTLAPLLSCPNAPLDSVEMVFWGREWQLGYTKHPPLVGWIAAAAVAITGSSLWGLFLIAQGMVAVCFWCAWRLGNEIAGPRIALAGAVALEGSFFLTFDSTVLNNNVGLYPFWALAILSFYRALKSGRNLHWLATGLWIGCGLLCKYSMAILPLVFAAFMVAYPGARRALRSPGPYLAALAGAATFAPHAWWAFDRGFPTLTYALDRTRNPSPVLGRLFAPLSFAAAEIVALALVFVIMLPLIGPRLRLRTLTAEQRWDRDYLLATTCGPFAALLLLSIVGNVHFRGMHGSHLWPMLGLTVLWTLAVSPTATQLRASFRLAATAGAILVAALVVRSAGSPYLVGRAARERFPGARLAAEIEQLWRERYGSPLTLVGGDDWLAGNIAFYSADCPSVHAQECSWMEIEEFRRRGGVLVWNARDWGDDRIPPPYRKLGAMDILPPVSLSHQTGADIPPARVGIAIIPPPGAGSQDSLARRPRGERAPARVAERAAPPSVKAR